MRQAQSPHQSSQIQLQVNGRIWNISNLSPNSTESTSNSTGSERRQVRPADLRAAMRKLYPSRGSIRRLLDDSENSQGGNEILPNDDGVRRQCMFKSPGEEQDTTSGSWHAQKSPVPVSEDEGDAKRRCISAPHLKSPTGLDCNPLYPDVKTAAISDDGHNQVAKIHPDLVASCMDLPLVQEIKNSPPAAQIQQEPPLSSFETSRLEIEVSPGKFLPLIGADGTAICVRQGKVHPTTCFSCGMYLYCAIMASCMYCPSCRVIGPLAFAESGGDTRPTVGLGLTEQHFQAEMAKV